MKTKPLYRRSAFYPTIGSILILVAGGVRGAVPWVDVLAECLIVVGLFLGSTRSPSVAAKDVPLDRADEWRGQTR